MAKPSMPHDRYLKIVHESGLIAETIKTEGWKLIEADMVEKANEIIEMLAQKRIRDHHETIYSKDGKRKETFITTADSEENKLAGRYLQIQDIFDFIQTVLSAPEKISKAEQSRQLVVEKSDKKTKIDYSIVYPDKVPQTIKKVLDVIKAKVYKR